MSRATIILQNVANSELDFDLGAISVNEMAMLGSLLKSMGLGGAKSHGTESDEIAYNSRLDPTSYLAKYKTCPQGYVADKTGKCVVSKLYKALSAKTSISVIDARLDPDEFYRKYRKCPEGFSKTMQVSAFDIMDDPKLRNSRMVICAPDRDERDFLIRTKKFD